MSGHQAWKIANSQAQRFALPPDWQENRLTVEGIAIDSEYTKDRDDMVAAYNTSHGTRLVVGVTDAGYFLQNQNHIMGEARYRQNTVYNELKAVRPMIPRNLSEDMFSLGHRKRTPIITVDMHIQDGEITRTRVYQAIGHATVMSYEQAAHHVRTKDEHLTPLQRVSQELFQRRTQENEAYLTREDGTRQRGVGGALAAHFIIQECMIAANVGIIGYMEDCAIPRINRVYQPDEAFEEHLTKLRSVMEIPPELLAPLGRAAYSTVPGPHIGLRVDRYAHTTSPLRRFADLATMSNLGHHLAGQRVPFKTSKLDSICDEINKRRNQSETTRQEQYLTTITAITRQIRALGIETKGALNSQGLQQILFSNRQFTAEGKASLLQRAQETCMTLRGQSELRTVINNVLGAGIVPNLSSALDIIESQVVIAPPSPQLFIEQQTGQGMRNFNALQVLQRNNRLQSWTAYDISEPTNPQAIAGIYIGNTGRQHQVTGSPNEKESLEQAVTALFDDIGYNTLWRLSMGESNNGAQNIFSNMEAYAASHAFILEQSTDRKRSSYLEHTEYTLSATRDKTAHTVRIVAPDDYSAHRAAASQLLRLMEQRVAEGDC